MSSKKLKLYVPVIMPKGQIMIGVHSSQSFQKIIPSKDIIRKYLENQSIMMSKGLPFSSIKISLSVVEFEVLRKELSRKCGGSYKSKVIDIVSELGQSPLIQIICKNG